ncbi:MAG: hypothetical protein ABI772_07440 [Bacteroidota bacterium]
MRLKSVLMMSVLVTASCINLNAQQRPSSKKTTIRIVTEENGKKTIIDTTFIDADPATLDAFMQMNGMTSPEPPPPPPAPPAPPMPLTDDLPMVPPIPPMPPMPPMPDESSFNFHFDMPDFDVNFNNDLNERMEDVKEQLENAKENLQKAMEFHFDQKEFEMRMEEIQKQLKDIKIETEKNNRKNIKSRKKTSGVDIDTDDNTGYIYNYSYPGYTYSYSSAGINDEPVIDIKENNSNGYNTCFSYSTTCGETKHRSKFRNFMNKVVEKILE